jgi:hypothetical protein
MRSFITCTYLLTYFLTPWCRILFEKRIVTQLVKKYPASLWNPKVHYRVHTSPPPDPIPSQLNPVRLIDPYLPKALLYVILPPTRRPSQWSLAFGPPNQNRVNTSPPLYNLYTSQNIITVTNWRRIRWTGHAAHKGKMHTEFWTEDLKEIDH